MATWKTAIFDRTQADVDYARQNRNSTAPLKGAMNAEDWNRIGGNIHFLAQTFLGTTPASKTNWQAPADIPREQDIAQLQTDLETLRRRYTVLVAETPPLPWTHFETINQVEQSLHQLHQLYHANESARNYTTELYAGQPIGVI